MTLYTKCIYAPINKKDGLRVCVMSRLTQNDGISIVEKLINGELFDVWYKILAPPENVVGKYLRGQLGWNAFKDFYLDSMKNRKAKQQIEYIAKYALTNNITLLCAEESPKFCHRRILAEECQIVQPNLEIIIK